VFGPEYLQTELGELVVWKVHSEAEIDLGVSTSDLWFSMEYGFVKIFSRNYAGQTILMEMVEVIDPN